MSDDEEFRFRPRPGRVRADAPKLGKAKSFLSQAKKLARQHSTARHGQHHHRRRQRRSGPDRRAAAKARRRHAPAAGRA